MPCRRRPGWSIPAPVAAPPARVMKSAAPVASPARVSCMKHHLLACLRAVRSVRSCLTMVRVALDPFLFQWFLTLTRSKFKALIPKNRASVNPRAPIIRMSKNMPKQNYIGHAAVPMVELWRGDRLESVHQGHAVVMGADGEILSLAGGGPTSLSTRVPAARWCRRCHWSNPAQAKAAEHGATGAWPARRTRHRRGMSRWSRAGWLILAWMTPPALRRAAPGDIAERDRLICTHAEPCQSHHECSGKHAGF